MATFAAQVEALARKYQMQLRATAKGAVQHTVKLAQNVKKEGGRMRVETGFLRASIVAAYDVMPHGTAVNPNPEEVITYDGKPIAAAIVRWRPETQVLFIGWAANYARPRESKDGFLRGATEQWSGTVNLIASNVKRRT
jgi:hypothetical protein